MKKTFVTIVQIAILIQMAWAGELTAISSKFVTAAKDGDIENLASTLWNVNQRSKEEQIHLKLFNEWSNLIEELLAEEAAPAGADQPAAKPAVKVPAKEQPSIPTSKVVPR
jgi:hypothetical protein